MTSKQPLSQLRTGKPAPDEIATSENTPEAALVEADVLQLALEPDVTELASLRTSVRSWFPESLAGTEAAENGLLAIDELVSLAIEATQGGHPVQIRLRHTHSILVAEVDAHVDTTTAGDFVARFNQSDERLAPAWVVRQLADRSQAEVGPSRITFACTFRFDNRPSAGSIGPPHESASARTCPRLDSRKRKPASS